MKITIVIIAITLISCNEKKSMQWSNPIDEGINAYGMKDFYLFSENDSYYLVGSEYPDPFQKGTTNPNLYHSENLPEWTKVTSLRPRTIPDSAWYHDEWNAPEIHAFEGMYYLTFNSRNNVLRPYKKTGFGIAVSESLTGPYQVINKDSPMAYTNHGSIVRGPDKIFYLVYDMDGRIYQAEIDLQTATLKEEPYELLGPSTLEDHYKYLDAPNITKVDETYHLLFTQFYGGYIVNVNHMSADDPKGPWHWSDNNPLYSFLEAEADTEVKMEYPEKYGFAPPTQVIFSHQIAKGPGDTYLMVYHSSEKYSEPYLCIEPIEVLPDSIALIAPKETQQKISF